MKSFIFIMFIGPRQICLNKMATKIGIFEKCYKKNTFASS